MIAEKKCTAKRVGEGVALNWADGGVFRGKSR